MRSPARGSIVGAYALLALALVGLAAAALFASSRVPWLIVGGVCGTVAAAVALFLLFAERRGRQIAALELRRSEGRLRGMVDSAMDAIITVDESQRVVLFNDAAETMFGWKRDEAMGTALANFIPERFRHAHAEHIARFGETRTTTRRMGGSD